MNAEARDFSAKAYKASLRSLKIVVPELVETLDEAEISAELQHRMLTYRMVGGEERVEAYAGHERFPAW